MPAGMIDMPDDDSPLIVKFERYEQGALLAILLKRLGVDSVTISRAELIEAGGADLVDRRDNIDGSITLRVR